MTKRDWLFAALLLAVLGIFIAISGKEKTAHIPYDDTHRRFYDIVQKDGKKAAEAFCKECHKDFPKNHPPAFRCLFCHKLDNR